MSFRPVEACLKPQSPVKGEKLLGLSRIVCCDKGFWVCHGSSLPSIGIIID